MNIAPLLLLILLAPLYAHAQGTDFVPLLPNFAQGAIQGVADSNNLSALLSQIYKICIGLAAVLAVLQIMFAGVQYMGGDSITEKKAARERITLAIMGLLLVLSPVIVFNIINPDILKLRIDTSNITPSGSATPAPTGTPSNPTPSTIDSTGKANPACQSMPDGTILNSSGGSQQNADEQCCVRQTANGQACQVKSTYDSNFNQIEYCSCSGN